MASEFNLEHLRALARDDNDEWQTIVVNEAIAEIERLRAELATVRQQARTDPEIVRKIREKLDAIEYAGLSNRAWALKEGPLSQGIISKIAADLIPATPTEESKDSSTASGSRWCRCF